MVPFASYAWASELVPQKFQAGNRAGCGVYRRGHPIARLHGRSPQHWSTRPSLLRGRPLSGSSAAVSQMLIEDQPAQTAWRAQLSKGLLSQLHPGTWKDSKAADGMATLHGHFPNTTQLVNSLHFHDQTRVFLAPVPSLVTFSCFQHYNRRKTGILKDMEPSNGF
ncbi:unnamed protein product [Durusdinium trenchii]|uniref:Uncharacterized protein n=1 Tax=Durusdinium trenchii TaxID=1381693 RepID=A0ABP0QXA1_9DINO